MTHRDIMVRAVRAAGEVVRRHFRTGIVESGKADDSPVTIADREAEDAILGVLLKQHPYAVIAEESGTKEADSEYAWVIDPIDGTSNFSHGLPFTGISIGLLRSGEPVEGVVYDPIGDELIYGGPDGVEVNGKPPMPVRTKMPYMIYDPNIYVVDGRPMQRIIGDLGEQMRVSVRALGCATLGMAYVAIGRSDAYIGQGQQPWDYAGPLAICRAAGCVCTDWDGSPLRITSESVIIATQAFYPELFPYVEGVKPSFRKREPPSGA